MDKEEPPVWSLTLKYYCYGHFNMFIVIVGFIFNMITFRHMIEIFCSITNKHNQRLHNHHKFFIDDDDNNLDKVDDASLTASE
ncbi:hypothetical protein DERF_000623 [Dermatophagoides farinae]|uniref:Uncharacterized protein n=1 Tax=Dermatophagoides farinae TaxID=6954 RepID=A0A922I940_DERFA|nr:hypothetical protein DERF_000623 [Dermatophagoides farinae]